MAWNKIVLCVAGAAVFCLVPGCSSDGMMACSGTVTFDGVSLSDGAISFCPFDKSVASQGSRIRDGRFQLRCRPGKYRVEILASRTKVGAEELSPGMPAMEQFIPACYNETSTLEVDVVPNGANRFPFELLPEPVTKAGGS